MSEPWTPIGQGVATSFVEPVEGELREVHGPADVTALTAEIEGASWAPPVILIHEAGGTTLGPLLGDIVGVVSTKGTLGAHVAILAKEYGCPCIVGASFDRPPAARGVVRLAPDGSVSTPA